MGTGPAPQAALAGVLVDEFHKRVSRSGRDWLGLGPPCDCPRATSG